MYKVRGQNVRWIHGVYCDLVESLIEAAVYVNCCLAEPHVLCSVPMHNPRTVVGTSFPSGRFSVILIVLPETIQLINIFSCATNQLRGVKELLRW